MKRLFLHFLLLLLALPAAATSIVIIVTPGYILVGADSKRIFLDARSNVTANESVCKIRSINKYCFVMAGYVASPTTLFSADSIVAHQLQTAGSYEKAVAGIKKEICKALQKDIRYKKMRQPESFAKLAASKEHLLEVALLHVKNGQPHIQIIGFRMNDDKQASVTSYTSACPGDCPNQQVQLYFLGEYSGMEHYLNAAQVATDPVLLVEQLIGIQATATPTSVGLPVKIIKYSAGGLEWMR